VKALDTRWEAIAGALGSALLVEAILDEPASATIKNCTFRECLLSSAGVPACHGGAVALIGCTNSRFTAWHFTSNRDSGLMNYTKSLTQYVLGVLKPLRHQRFHFLAKQTTLVMIA
jgi:hypothetical protein